MNNIFLLKIFSKLTMVYKSIMAFYIKYKFYILIISLIVASVTTIGLIIFYLKIPSVIIGSSLIYEELVEEFPQPITAENIEYAKSVIIETREFINNSDAFLNKVAPTNLLTEFIRNTEPNNILKDMMQRPYYVFTDSMIEPFQSLTNIRTWEEVEKLIRGMDPLVYRNFHSTFESAFDMIMQNDRDFLKAKDLITKENILIKDKQTIFLIGIGIGIGGVIYFSYKLATYL